MDNLDDLVKRKQANEDDVNSMQIRLSAWINESIYERIRKICFLEKIGQKEFITNALRKAVEHYNDTSELIPVESELTTHKINIMIYSSLNEDIRRIVFLLDAPGYKFYKKDFVNTACDVAVRYYFKENGINCDC